MPMTLTINDELAKDVKPYEAQIAEILALGIREFRAREEIGYNGLNSVLEKLAALPTPDEVLAFRPAPALQARMDALLEKNRTSAWTVEEKREWEQFEYVEHLIRLAKATAARKLKGANGA